MAKNKNNNENEDDDNGFKFMSGDDFLKRLREDSKRNQKMHDIGMKTTTDGYSDIAEAMHVIGDEINRSDDLNIASMLTVSRTFEAVFGAFMKEADAHSVSEDTQKKFLTECGIVMAGEEGCFHCAPGGIRLHDLQVIAGMAAMRFFLFARLRKISSSLPIIRQMVEDGGNPDTALQMLHEAMSSAASMMLNLDKLGFSLREDHPIATKAREGVEEARALATEILASKNKS